MNRVIVHSSVAIKWFFTEPFSAEAVKLLRAYEKGTVTLLATDLIYAEVGNIVWKKHRFQGVAAEDAQQVIDEFRRLPIETTSSADLLADAYRLAVTYQRTVYDALYVALSIREHAVYLSADEKLVNAVSSDLPDVVWIAKWQ